MYHINFKEIKKVQIGDQFCHGKLTNVSTIKNNMSKHIGRDVWDMIPGNLIIKNIF